MKCQQLNIFLVVFLNQIKFSQKVIYCMEIKYNCSQYMYLYITVILEYYFTYICFVSVLNTNLDTHSNSRAMFLIREVNNISKGYLRIFISLPVNITQVAKGIKYSGSRLYMENNVFLLLTFREFYQSLPSYNYHAIVLIT